MLYDPKWKQKTTMPSLEGLIAWLETQDLSTSYNYFAPYNCVMGRYIQSCGVEDFGFSPDELRNLHPSFNDIAQDSANLLQEDWTYGGALKRARAAL
jgi:hypothetical protein